MLYHTEVPPKTSQTKVSVKNQITNTKAVQNIPASNERPRSLEYRSIFSSPRLGLTQQATQTIQAKSVIQLTGEQKQTESQTPAHQNLISRLKDAVKGRQEQGTNPLEPLKSLISALLLLDLNEAQISNILKQSMGINITEASLKAYGNENQLPDLVEFPPDSIKSLAQDLRQRYVVPDTSQNIGGQASASTSTGLSAEQQQMISGWQEELLKSPLSLTNHRLEPLRHLILALKALNLTDRKIHQILEQWIDKTITLGSLKYYGQKYLENTEESIPDSVKLLAKALYQEHTDIHWKVQNQKPTSRSLSTEQQQQKISADLQEALKYQKLTKSELEPLSPLIQTLRALNIKLSDIYKILQTSKEIKVEFFLFKHYYYNNVAGSKRPIPNLVMSEASTLLASQLVPDTPQNIGRPTSASTSTGLSVEQQRRILGLQEEALKANSQHKSILKPLFPLILAFKSEPLGISLEAIQKILEKWIKIKISHKKLQTYYNNLAKNSKEPIPKETKSLAQALYQVDTELDTSQNIDASTVLSAKQQQMISRLKQEFSNSKDNLDSHKLEPLRYLTLALKALNLTDRKIHQILEQWIDKTITLGSLKYYCSTRLDKATEPIPDKMKSLALALCQLELGIDTSQNIVRPPSASTSTGSSSSTKTRKGTKRKNTSKTDLPLVEEEDTKRRKIVSETDSRGEAQRESTSTQGLGLLEEEEIKQYTSILSPGFLQSRNLFSPLGRGEEENTVYGTMPVKEQSALVQELLESIKKLSPEETKIVEMVEQLGAQQQQQQQELSTTDSLLSASTQSQSEPQQIGMPSLASTSTSSEISLPDNSMAILKMILPTYIDESVNTTDKDIQYLQEIRAKWGNTNFLKSFWEQCIKKIHALAKTEIPGLEITVEEMESILNEEPLWIQKPQKILSSLSQPQQMGMQGIASTSTQSQSSFWSIFQKHKMKILGYINESNDNSDDSVRIICEKLTKDTGENLPFVEMKNLLNTIPTWINLR